MGSALNVALPTIGKELAMDALALSWVSTSYLLISVILVVPFGRIADIYGRKKIFTWGMILFIITAFLLSITNSGGMLITLRFVQGVGGALANATYIALLMSAFAPNERGKVLGLNGAAVYAGFLLGTCIGGLLAQNLGWRSIFWIGIILGIVIVAIIFWRMKGDWVEGQGEKFDTIGSLIYSWMLVTIIYGFTHLPNMLGIWLILIGIVASVAFVIWEMRTPSPVLQINLFKRNRVFTLSCLAVLINFGATYAVSFLLSLYLQYIKGFSPQNAGLMLMLQPIVLVILSPLAGRLSDRIQPRLIAIAGMVCCVIGLGLFVFLNADTTLLQIVAGMILMGLGIGFFASPNANATMSSVEKKFHGVASATLPTMRQLGMNLSMGIVMMLFALYIGNVQITPEYYAKFMQSVNVSFIIFTVLSLFGVAALLLQGIKSKTDHREKAIQHDP